MTEPKTKTEPSNEKLIERIEELEERQDKYEKQHQQIGSVVEQFQLGQISRRTFLTALGATGLIAGGVGYASAHNASPSWGSATGQMGEESTPLNRSYIKDLHTKTLETDDLQTKLADGQIHFASQYSGGDIESRLDSALSAAGSKEMVVLEPGSYNDRTISQAINIIAPIAGLGSGAVIANNKKWTINTKSHIRGLDIQGTVDITANNTRLREMTVRNGADITVNGSSVTIMGVHGAGSVTFTNGNGGGEIGIVSGAMSVTDNDGGNNIL